MGVNLRVGFGPGGRSLFLHLLASTFTRVLYLGLYRGPPRKSEEAFTRQVRDAAGYTALLRAAEAGNEAATNLLLEASAGIQVTRDSTVATVRARCLSSVNIFALTRPSIA